MPTIKARAAKEDDLEDRIQRDLEQRDRKGTTFRELVALYRILWFTLSDRARGGNTLRQAHEDY